MVKDPVCGMQVDPQKAAVRTEYKEQSYCFCSESCKKTFENNPEKYTGAEAAKTGGCCA